MKVGTEAPAEKRVFKGGGDVLITRHGDNTAGIGGGGRGSVSGHL